MELEELDKRILYELDLNARQSVSDLARRLAVSRDRILYRLKKLQSDEVISGFSAIVNTHKLGLFVYKTYLRLDKNDKRTAAFIQYLAAHPLVTWLAETDGMWDVAFSVYARDPVEFYATQGQILVEFSDIISHFSVYTLVDAFCFPKSYLVGVGTGSWYFGGGVERNIIDELDLEILRLVSTDSRISKAEIAEKLSIGPMVVKYRIDRLEDRKILVGYPIDIDVSKLDMLEFKLQLQLGAYDRHSEQQLVEYCKTNPYVTHFIRQIGDCMVEIEICAKNYQHMNEIVAEIRKVFSKFVRNVDTLFLRKQSYKWVPFDSEHFEGEFANVVNT